MIEDVITLDNKIFGAYIKRKSDSLQGIIEHGMSVGYFDWEHAGDPTEVRSYIREILLYLVLIHAEVYAVSALIVPRVMHRLVNILSKEFLECISEVEAFNVNGVIHVRSKSGLLGDNYWCSCRPHTLCISADVFSYAIESIHHYLGTFKKDW